MVFKRVSDLFPPPLYYPGTSISPQMSQICHSLQLSNIPLKQGPYIFFIQLSVDGYTGFFQDLAIMNYSAISLSMHVLL